ncbi:MAG TPA: helix-turn-helix domain-containing protein [Solirubrobacterales bacterium]|nr:helix-turn-helix domain-containing protein [Solirubrobacterales bacterium]
MSAISSRMACRTPAPPLRDGVRCFVHWEERAAGGTIARREPAQDCVTLIFNLGSPIAVSGPGEARHRCASFIAPMNGAWGLTETSGVSTGAQVDLDPRLARRILGVPLNELDTVVVPLGDVLGGWVAETEELLAGSSSPVAALELLECRLLGLLERGAAPSPEVDYAWSMLQASAGTVAVGALSERLGCSRRHLARRFGEQIGCSPKRAARIIRFTRALERLGAGDRDLAAAAAAGGWADQPHMNRDFAEFGGIAPSRLLASALGEGLGYGA